MIAPFRQKIAAFWGIIPLSRVGARRIEEREGPFGKEQTRDNPDDPQE